MANLTEIIEDYIKQLFEENNQNMIEIRRCDLASKFKCAPSQINYVLDTRFTVEKGYIIESRRGGGGFIRILRVDMDYENEFISSVTARIDDQISQHYAEGIISTFYENDIITEREKALLKAAVNRKTIGLKLPLRDRVRARILKNMLVSLCKKE